jgi:hypothetical protein
MKKLAASLALAAAFALLPAQAASADTLDLSAGVFPDDQFAALSSSGDPFAVGGGTETFQGRTLHFAFSAHQNSPNPPTGYVVLNNVAPPPLFTGGQAKIEGPVQCLAILAGFFNSNVANMVFTVKKTNSTDFVVGEQIIWDVRDNGNPNNQTTPDTSSYTPSSLNPNAVSAICNGQVSGIPGAPVTQGNIVVKD